MDKDIAPPLLESGESEQDVTTALQPEAVQGEKSTQDSVQAVVEIPVSHSPAHNNFDTLTFSAFAFVLLFGIGFAVVMPPLQFNDEHAHFGRAYQISRGEILGRTGSLPPEILAFISHYPEGYSAHESPQVNLPEIFNRQRTDSLSAEDQAAFARLKLFRWGLRATQAYLPLLYLPSAIGVLVARVAGLSPLGMMYVARLMDVLFFLAAFTGSLLLAPNFRGLLIGIGLIPMTLHATAAISADAMTNALALLAFGLVLHTREHRVNRVFLGILLAVVTLLVLSKNSIWAPLLLLLIPRDQFSSRQKRIVYLALAAFASMAGVIAWRMLIKDVFVDFQAVGASRGIDFYANAWRFGRHPFATMRDLLSARGYTPLEIVGKFIGVFGWQLFPLPWHNEFFVMLVMVGIFEANPERIKPRERVILASIFAGALLFTYFSLYVVDGNYVDGHAGFLSGGFQGRYMIPFCLAGFLALKQRWKTLPTRTIAPIVLAALTFYDTGCLVWISSYYYGNN